MVDKYFSAVNLPYLEERISQVFLEKPLVVLFDILPSSWVYDEGTEKMKSVKTIDTTGFSGELMGEINLNLDSLESVGKRIDIYDTVQSANVQLLACNNENNVLTMEFYSDYEIDADIPIVLTITGEMPKSE